MKKTLFSWNPTTTRSIVIKKIKTFPKNYFWKKNLTKKRKKISNSSASPVELCLWCAIPRKNCVIEEGGFFLGVSVVGRGQPPHWPLPWYPPPPPNIKIRIVKNIKKVCSSVELIATRGHKFFIGSQFLAEIGNTWIHKKKIPTPFCGVSNSDGVLLTTTYTKKMLNKKGIFSLSLHCTHADW